MVNQILTERPTSLPLGPELEVVGVSVRNCSYFNSNTLPLKIHFVGPDGGLVPAIFKVRTFFLRSFFLYELELREKLNGVCFGVRAEMIFSRIC